MFDTQTHLSVLLENCFLFSHNKNIIKISHSINFRQKRRGITRLSI